MNQNRHNWQANRKREPKHKMCVYVTHTDAEVYMFIHIGVYKNSELEAYA